jgi:peptidoglycan-associated lipoprotein
MKISKLPSLFRTLVPVTMLLLLSACAGNDGVDNPVIAEDLEDGQPIGMWDDPQLQGDDILSSRVGFPSSPVAAMYDPVYFGFDSSSVSSSEMSKVRSVAQHLNANPRQAVIIQGHTDERGSREYNLALGERRALAVREVLMSMGVGADRIQTLSFGEEQPAVPGFDESAWSMNRRAEFQLMQ